MNLTSLRQLTVLTLFILLGTTSIARAQSNAPDRPWSAEVAIGWDNGITGNINSSGVGTINNQVVVITKNSYNDVYGAGLHLRFGGGYLFKPDTEARVTFTFQSLDADYITPMGGIGFVDKTDVTLIAPGANLVTQANDFYDQTAAFTLGVNVGIDVQSGKHVGYFGQL